MKFKLCALVVAGSLAAGCQTYDPYTGEKKTANATTGAVIGAVAGAAIGAATSSKKDRGKGALIGAAAGGTVGGGIGYYMDKQESELRHRLEGTGVRVVRNGDEITLVMPGNITFDTGRSDVKANFYDTLDSVGLVLKEFDKTIIQVSGHTDSTGSLDLNQRLSEQRASSVGRYLISQGVLSSRVQTIGYGPRYPVATNSTTEGRAANRRVELKLVPMQG
ncbi:glycine zipper 2TM domain-containing protein [Hahella sp. KA22]|uniref:OmpA family protein n=1 Tax=Hahella sp. KA22 TaxID=1628392 RepID=UPI000FDD226C|nr:OmpA family protein [Hahella sp. KA22]AZZ93881.1 glycine zipper 2TM domain-containing protein [Hahella sp. KA22]QAY57254.1 glycine zipper 2TM domain-containing protein [Hahella sp. KA22]